MKDKYGEDLSRMTTEPNLSDTWLLCSDRLAMMDETVLQASIYGKNFDCNTIRASIYTGQEISGFVHLTKGARLFNNENRQSK